MIELERVSCSPHPDPAPGPSFHPRGTGSGLYIDCGFVKNGISGIAAQAKSDRKEEGTIITHNYFIHLEVGFRILCQLLQIRVLLLFIGGRGQLGDVRSQLGDFLSDLLKRSGVISGYGNKKNVKRSAERKRERETLEKLIRPKRF